VNLHKKTISVTTFVEADKSVLKQFESRRNREEKEK
jgi:hypothetical protein